jgi:hypothetical protein
MRNGLATMILLLVAMSAFSQGVGPCQNGQPGLEPYCAPPPPVNSIVMPKQTLPPVPTYTAPPVYVPEAVEIPHAVREPESDFHGAPANNPPSAHNLPNPDAAAPYIQQRNTQNYATGQQIGNAVGASLANQLAVRKSQAMQQSILQLQKQDLKLTEELAAKKEADRRKNWAQIELRGDNYEASNAIVKTCIDGSMGLRPEISCERAYGTLEGFIKACNGSFGSQWFPDPSDAKGRCGDGNAYSAQQEANRQRAAIAAYHPSNADVQACIDDGDQPVFCEYKHGTAEGEKLACYAAGNHWMPNLTGSDQRLGTCYPKSMNLATGVETIP